MHKRLMKKFKMINITDSVVSSSPPVKDYVSHRTDQTMVPTIQSDKRLSRLKMDQTQEIDLKTINRDAIEKELLLNEDL